ncbi:MAG: hypothetical protein GYA52_02225 [Chloroflexi bacterium]|nr:hypothetical protein [Chloroflexota bacterium]
MKRSRKYPEKFPILGTGTGEGGPFLSSGGMANTLIIESALCGFSGS